MDFKIGTDLEFLILCESGAIVNASDYGGNASETGVDGNGVSWEVRPDPSYDPIDVVNNINDIFNRFLARHPELITKNWQSGSFVSKYPMGGHIHFGTGAINFKDAMVIQDNYVSALTILIETYTEGKKRREFTSQGGKNYGFYGDYRKQPHGFENRVPGCFLESPYITAAILCLSKVVMYEYLNNRSFDWRNYLSDTDITLMNISKIRANFPKIWNDIKKMQMYNEYKDYINLIYFLISEGLTWKPRIGMKEAWGLMDTSGLLRINGKKMTIENIWKK